MWVPRLVGLREERAGCIQMAGLWEEATGAEIPWSEGEGAWGSRLRGLSLLGAQALCCELKRPPHHPP